MKLLIITLEYPPQTGGIASYVLNFAAHLLPDDVVVYAPPAPDSKMVDDGHLWKVYRKNPYFFWWWPHWVRLFWQVFLLIKREQITHVQVHHVLPVGYVAFLIKKLLGIPYTVFLHGTDIQLATRTKLKRAFLQKILAEADRIVVNSLFLESKVKDLVPAGVPIMVSYPCPGEQFFKPVAETRQASLRAQLALNGKKVIITVGRLAEGKGFPHMITILPNLLEKIPNLVWLILGDGPKKGEIIKQITEGSLQNVVRFLGAVPPDDLPVYYSLADLFVLLSHPDEFTEEGFGTVFLEAAALGLPSVAGRAGGTAEAVEHLVTGFIVDVNQKPAVVEAITGLLLNPEYAKQLGAAGKQRVLSEFNWERQLKKIELANN